MGLDMYLTCNSRRIVDAAWEGKEDDWRYSKFLKIYGYAAYWRKANHIHNWFVDNVQLGNDNCEYYDVEPEQLQELLNVVNDVLDSTCLVDGLVTYAQSYIPDTGWVDKVKDGKVLKDTHLAEKLLPTKSGFFFGGTDYAEWYWDDLEYTRDVLTNILDNIEKVPYELPSGTGEAWMVKGDTDWEVRFQYRSSW